MVLILPPEFSAPGGQVDGLDDDVAEGQLGQRPRTKEELLAVAFNEVIPRDDPNKYRHLKPLYISAHVEGVPISKVFVDCGATVNVLPCSLMKKLAKTREDLIPSDVVMSSFVGDKSKTVGVLPLEITAGCIPSSLFQLLFFWDGQKVSIHPADEKPFETNAVQARIYDDDVGWVVLTGHDANGRPTRTTAQKVLELGAENARQDSARESLQPNSPINLIEFLHETGGADALTIDDLEIAPAEMEDDYPEVQDPLLEINVGTEAEPRPLFVRQLLDPGLAAEIIGLLHEYKDCFAWDYHEMPGLPRSLVEHELKIKEGFKPFQQPPRQFSTEVQLKVKEEIERLLEAGFIRTARYVEWLANIVPVLKKTGALRICTDYRNLNLATPKDEYPMPMSDLLVDGAAKHELLSFMDGHAGYNQIFIAEEDIHKTAFRCPGAIGTYEWVVMPFGLKNAGATYQRAMNLIFHDLIGRTVEVYIDDVVVKSPFKADHPEHLRQAFARMRSHGLKMNPKKCAFGVTAGNFLEQFIWGAEHQAAFDDIKKYLSQPPVLMPPKRGKPLRLYISASESSIGCLLAQNNEFEREQAVHYLSRTLNVAELNYSPVEKLCLALYFAATKLRHYMLPSVVQIISKTDLIKYMLTRPIIRGRIGKWTMALSEFTFQYVAQRSVKGQALADFLAHHPTQGQEEETEVEIGMARMEKNY
ncbi:unnamed protein product [Prunus brigantina]